MDGTAINAARDAFAKPEVVIIDGLPRVFAPNGWADRTPGIAQVSGLALNTLTGIVDYLEANIDGLSMPGLMVHVLDESTVRLVAKLESEDLLFRRTVYLTATAPGTKFPFGQYQDAETFLVGLQTAFVPTEQRDALVSLIASIRESDVRETVDDGVAQEVKTARGVALSDRTKVPNPVHLQPYRTFREIDQPGSSFVLRLQSGNERPRCALFEADGGSWKLDAIEAIADWLKTSVKGVAVVA